MDLEKSLQNFEKQFGRKIVINPEDNSLYEDVNGMKPIKFDCPEISAEDKGWDCPLRYLAFKGIEVYKDNISELSPSDKALRELVINYVHETVIGELVKKGYYEKKGEDYRPTGGCPHDLWGETQKILFEKYGIRWESYQDANPRLLID